MAAAILSGHLSEQVRVGVEAGNGPRSSRRIGGSQFGQGKHASTVDKLHRAASDFIDKQNPNGGRAPGDGRGPVDPPR